MDGSELALTVVAAWALGRIGDEQALEPLRAALNADYRSVRAHSARALAGLGDQESAPLMLQRLLEEPDKGLQMAYASALGTLRKEDATVPILDLLETTTNSGARLELAISLGRIVGDEGYFVQFGAQCAQRRWYDDGARPVGLWPPNTPIPRRSSRIWPCADFLRRRPRSRRNGPRRAPPGRADSASAFAALWSSRLHHSGTMRRTSDRIRRRPHRVHHSGPTCPSRRLGHMIHIHIHIHIHRQSRADA
ncbi:MAG: HEAT repeat domain-containing protein [Caldilineaceae bacterium]|nr:HEAT repeat domain-containing protein [Caldilineaceae bacterium]